MESVQRALQLAYSNSSDSQKKQFSELFALTEEEETSSTKAKGGGRGRKPGPKPKKTPKDVVSESSEESSEVSSTLHYIHRIFAVKVQIFMHIIHLPEVLKNKNYFLRIEIEYSRLLFSLVVCLF